MADMSIGKRIKERRIELGLTQEELGKRLGWGKSAVCRLETEGNNITTERLNNVALALDTTKAHLLGEDTERNRLNEIGSRLTEERLKELTDYAEYLLQKQENE